MNWDCLIIAAAIAASLTYLALRCALKKHARNVCGSSSSGCACRLRASEKRHGVHGGVHGGVRYDD
jgi:hypothetical protein